MSHSTNSSPGKIAALAAALLLLVGAYLGSDRSRALAQSDGATQGKARKDDLKQAARLADRGDKALAAGKTEEAVREYAAAVKAAPGDISIARRAAAGRAQVVQRIVDDAEAAALNGEMNAAIELMYKALQIDPGDTFVAERLNQMKQMPKEYLPRGDKEDWELSGPPALRPQPGKKAINIRGDLKSAYQQIAGMFGIRVAFDPELTSKNIKLHADDLDFYTAMQLLGLESSTFYNVVNPTLIFVAQDNIAKRREFTTEVERTFRLNDSIAAEDITEMMRVIREITNSTHMNMDARNHSLTVRESADKVVLAAQLIKELEQARRDVMLDIEMLEVNRNAALNLGVTQPSSVQAIPLSSNTVKQLEQATDVTNLVTLVSQVFTAQGISASPQDVLPFGGGKSTFLLTMPSATANFSRGLSLVRSGRSVFMRAQDGKPATFFVGTRYPVTLALLSTSLGGTTVGGAVTSTVFPQTNFAVGHNPVAVVAQDFTNDARPDLAVANQGDSSISILINKDSGNFSAATNSPIVLGANEQGPSAITTGVFRVTDATHLVQPADLVIANSRSDTVSVLLGSQNFDGTFAEATGSPFTVGTHPRAVAAGDFDGDGFLDFAVVNEGDSSISTFKGDGKGGFTEFPGSPFRMRGPLGIGTTSLPGGVAGATYSTTLRSSGGTGQVNWTVTSGTLPSGLALNASNGVISGTPGAAGTANFSVTATDSASPAASVTKSLSIEIDATAPAFSILAASLLNGFVGAGYSQSLAATGGTPPYTWSVSAGALPPQITLNASSGALSGTATAGMFSFTVQVADSSATPLVAVKQFALTPISPRANDEQGPIAIATARFDSSGLPEFAILNAATENIGVFQASGANSGANAFVGTFTELSGSPVATGTNPVAFAAGDLNADGFADLAIVNQSLNQATVLLNDGTGVFKPAAGSPLPTASTPAGVAIADFTNDGLGDIAVTNNGAGTLGVYAGLGLGEFSQRIELTTPAGPLAVITSPLTSSGLPDAIVTSHTSSSDLVTVLLDPSNLAGLGAGGLINSALQSPYPASEYVDLGVKVKATPAVHDNNEVTLQLEFEIRALSGASVNGIPIITNRTVSQTVRLREGEPTMIAGLLDREETKSLNGIPGFANLPGANYVFANHNNSSTNNELLIVVTPRRLSDRSVTSRARFAGRGSGGVTGPVALPGAAP